MEKSSERDYWIGRDWSGAAGNVCRLLRKRRPAIRAFVFFTLNFSFLLLLKLFWYKHLPDLGFLHSVPCQHEGQEIENGKTFIT